MTKYNRTNWPSRLIRGDLVSFHDTSYYPVDESTHPKQLYFYNDHIIGDAYYLDPSLRARIEVTQRLVTLYGGGPARNCHMIGEGPDREASLVRQVRALFSYLDLKDIACSSVPTPIPQSSDTSTAVVSVTMRMPE